MAISLEVKTLAVLYPPPSRLIFKTDEKQRAANPAGMIIQPQRPLRAQPYRAHFYGGVKAAWGLILRDMTKYLIVKSKFFKANSLVLLITNNNEINIYSGTNRFC